MLEKFLQHIKEKGLFIHHDHLLIAVSGGVDSVVLCHLCKQAGFTFSIAHCNFQLRGEESERDARFVKALAEKYEVPLHFKKFDTEKYVADNKISIQEAARELRYQWFFQLIKTQDSQLSTPNFLLTAHHADDNIETLLMHFFRGTGLHGLTGIPSTTDYIRRPLLPFYKEQILEYAKSEGLSFVEDLSNQSNKYTRNFFRNELLPAIGKVYPQVNENLYRNIERFTSIEKLYQIGISAIKQKLCKQKGNELHIPVKQLAAHNSNALVYEIISPYGFQEKQIDEVKKLCNSESGKYVDAPSGTHRMIRHRHWLIISPVKSSESVNIIIEEADKMVEFAMGRLEITVTQNIKPETSSLIACIDRHYIKYPLLLRRYKAGDYFYPLGIRKKKKVARFLIDQKLSKSQKENVWVIESNKKIIWVVGYRIDDRVKLSESTTSVLKLSLHA